jgi:DNA-binding response OmpR family regulator
MSAPRILIVEDEPTIREILKDRLESAGYDVRAVGSAEEALKLSLLTYSLMITDGDLPGMSGVALAREIKSTRPFIGMIMFSGDDRHEEGFLQAGGIRFIHKTQTAELMDAIAYWFDEVPIVGMI